LRVRGISDSFIINHLFMSPVEVRQIDPALPEALEGAKPENLWAIFNALRQIPRETGNEGEVVAFVAKWAQENGFEYAIDEAAGEGKGFGNICVKVPGSPGCEEKPSVCLQGHLDMVCEKPKDSGIDFTTHAIQVERDPADSDWLRSEGKGTTLGADNGIGVAAAMAVATDPTVGHPPLELLFTIDEEGGLNGVFGMDVGRLGLESATMINLDTEEFAELYIKTAGGQDVSGTMPVERIASEEVPEGKYLEISIDKMAGGHSGVYIHENRGNVILAMREFLQSLVEQYGDAVQLVSFNGGTRRNVIPSSASAVIFVSKEELVGAVEEQARSFEEVLRGRYKFDPGDPIVVKAEVTNRSSIEVNAVRQETRDKVLNVLGEVGGLSGVVENDPNIPGLVQTSMNTATIRTFGDAWQLGLNIRSSVDERLEAHTGLARQALERGGMEAAVSGRYPGWSADADSELVRRAAEACDEPTKVKGIHAGLETGFLVNAVGAKIGQTVQAVSMGPTIKDPHSVDERVHIPSVEKFYRQLGRLMGMYAVQAWPSGR